MENFPAPGYPAAEQKLDLSDYNSTIFVSIASYRDPEINKTLESMYSTAHFPDLLYVAVHFQESEEVNLSEERSDDAGMHEQRRHGQRWHFRK